MKVDFPQPESAATPMIRGATPSLRAMLRLLEEEGPRRVEGMKAGLKAAAEAMEAAKRVKLNFMFSYLSLTEIVRLRVGSLKLFSAVVCYL